MKCETSSSIGILRDVTTPANPIDRGHEPIADDAAWLVALLDGGESRAAIARAVAARTEARLGATGRGLRLVQAELCGRDLRDLDLRRTDLSRAQLHGARLDGARLDGATLICPAMERTSLQGAVLRGAYVHAWAAQVCDLSGADLRDLVDATGSLFHGCRLVDAHLGGATLSGTSFYQCSLDDADLGGAQLQGCTFTESRCVRTRFERSDVDHATFNRSDLSGCTMAGARGIGVAILAPLSARDLVVESAALPELRVAGMHAPGMRASGLSARGSSWQRTSLPGAALGAADLSGSHFVDCRLDDADLSLALLDDASWLRVTADRARLERACAENFSMIGGSLVGAELGGVKARCARVRNSDWRGVGLREAYLYRASITGDPPLSMCLAGADLSGAVLVQAYLAADLEGARLPGASAAYARLNQSRFDDADMRGVSLFEASMVKCGFEGTQMQGVAAPWFSDRCTGLADALRRCDAGDPAVGFEAALRDLLARQRRGST
ncbi:MAG TPA: pentapeptide repeat-containing protein [Nannocystaceae bacterium]|nr:pentapeptide repeat-containing protein [Nannocystaceae bacterium]